MDPGDCKGQDVPVIGSSSVTMVSAVLVRSWSVS